MGRKLRKMEVLYVKDGNLGEWIEVKFWRSSWSEDVFHCNIVDAKTFDILTYALVDFYPPDYSSNIILEL
nr:hypothetical protein BaRGS_026507 [Batillaria attramentaria]